MIVTMVADLHNTIEQLSRLRNRTDRALLIGGDITHNGTLEELYKFNEYVKTLNFDYVILTPGNHDIGLQKPILVEKILSDCIVLIDEYVVLENIKIYGTPWTKYYKKEFNAFTLPDETALQEKWEGIPKDTDILITHCPPRYIRDFEEGKNIGSKTLLKRVKKLQPYFHLFGHAHLNQGFTTEEWEEDNGFTNFVNGAVVDNEFSIIGGVDAFQRQADISTRAYEHQREDIEYGDRDRDNDDYYDEDSDGDLDYDE